MDRPHKVWRHTIGDDPARDACVWHEEDEAFYVHVSRTRDDALLLIQADSALTTEVAALDAATPRGQWRVLFPRVHDTQYEVGHRGGQLVYSVRDAARPNSELLAGPADDPLGPAARVLVPHSPSEKIEDFVIAASFIAVFKRVDGLQQCFAYKAGAACPTLPAPLKKGSRIAFPDPSYELGAGPQGDWESPVLRLAYSSLATPASTLDLDTSTGRQATKRVAPVLGGFDPANYKCERLWAASADGTRVPISLVYRPDLRDAGGGGPQPLLLNAYGAYEACSDAAFGYTQNRLPLLDRGFAFAIAHARGGGELGRAWYEDGKFGNKANTFADVVAAGHFLVEAGWTSPDVLCLEGRSAGGADGRGDPECGAHPLPGGHRGRALCGRPVDDGRRLAPADRHRKGGVGRPGRPGRVRGHGRLLSHRLHRAGRGLPRHPGDGRPARPAGGVLGARQVGGHPARQGAAAGARPAQDRHGGRPLLQVGAVCCADGEGDGAGICAQGGRQTGREESGGGGVM